MERVIIDLLKEFSKKLPVYIFSGKFTLASFIALAIATIIYGYLMLDEEVDNWKEGLKWTAVWVFMSILGRLLSFEDLREIADGMTSSIPFVLGSLGLSVAYIVISIRACFVRASCLVRGISILIALVGVVDITLYVQILISELN